MPSCVVRCCKNFGKKINKSQGITYHEFPREKYRKDVWVQIIRDCRGESNWNPSPSSNVCSAHFDNEDFIITAKGRRRLFPYAIPKRLLSESPPETQITCTSSSMREMPATVRDMAEDLQPPSSSGMISSLSQVLTPSDTKVAIPAGYCRFCAAAYCYSKLLNIQSDDDLNKLVVNMTDRLNTNVDFSQEHLPTTICFECLRKLYTAYDFVVGVELAQMTLNDNLMQNDQCRMRDNIIFSNMESSTSIQRVLPNSEAAEYNFQQSLPFATNMTTPAPQLSPNIGAATSKVVRPLLLESNSTIPFLLDSPRKRRLKIELEKKRLVIEKQKKNLKRLNQKVRRLENRNESLKNIVKNLKDKYTKS